MWDKLNFLFQHAPHMWAINKALHVHTMFNQMGMVANQDRAPHSDTMLISMSSMYELS